MSDLIKREDAIKALIEWYGCKPDDIEAFEKIIEAIPTADRPQEWIPCSERLPSEQGQYLVTFPLCNGEPWVYILSFNKGKFYETDDEWGDVEYDDVTAWMPLPKPWKGADDE
jgi:hypothetical protein